jgi:8-oxo-dGTP pyrophosphatase MutT (NUDIX family)
MILKSVSIEIDKDYFEYMRTGKGNLDTRSEVVMVLPRPGGKVLTLTKSFYPSGTYNLPSGGIHPGETPEEAFAREVAEETGLHVALQSQIGRLDHILGFAGRPGRRILFTSHVMLGAESVDTPHPRDEGENISGYIDAGIEDLRRFAEQMRSFTGRWLGFGRFRATALELVADYLIDLPALLR